MSSSYFENSVDFLDPLEEFQKIQGSVDHFENHSHICCEMYKKDFVLVFWEKKKKEQKCPCWVVKLVEVLFRIPKV